mmetsp:Transcript_16277/g.34393  ORF Transcript_16277/g.34393 Transcript_16277/m.34393 type:complete len:138 (+) Transcript_16277:406-819(+)
MNLYRMIITTMIASTKIVDGKLIPFSKLIENAKGQDCTSQRNNLQVCISSGKDVPSGKPSGKEVVTVDTFGDCILHGQQVTCDNICSKYEACKEIFNAPDCSSQTVAYINCNSGLSCATNICSTAEEIDIDVKNLRA